MVSQNEFSHVVKAADIGAGQTQTRLAAGEDERAALAIRFDLLSLASLEADIALWRDARGILAEGRMRASLEQPCIATGEPVPDRIDEAVRILFVPEPADTAEAEVELDTDDCDAMFYDGQSVDLGEAIAQSLGLALNPYPRSPNAEAALKKAGVINEEAAQQESSPFGALASLKDKLPPR